METQDEDDVNVDIAEVKKVLEDANMYEPNMSRPCMISYYKVLKNSESTASEEDETRRFNQSQTELKDLLDTSNTEDVEKAAVPSKEKPFIPKSWTSEKKISLDSALESNKNENSSKNIVEETITDLFRDATKTVFGYNEMANDLQNTLTIVTHELELVPIHSSSKYLNAEIVVRARMLYAYHTKVNRKKRELARLSFYPAPLPKLISTTETFPSFSDIDDPETYISRSGRQTKRKIYNDDIEEETFENVAIKKVKSSDEVEWKSKPAPAKSSVRSQKKQEFDKIVENSKNEVEVTEKEKKVYPKKEPLLKKMSNTEIMKRSNLFAPKKRWEKMFDKLSEDEENKDRKEKAMEIFNKTLEELDEEDSNEININEEIVTITDEVFMRRRITPPIPNKKMARKRSNTGGLTPLDVKINSPSQKKNLSITEPSSSQDREEVTSTTRTPIRRRPPIRKAPITIDALNSLPSTSGTSKGATNKVTCPICDGVFEENKIEEHAATCGEPSPTASSPKMKRITCEVCDKVVEFDTNYEVHVKECIAKKKDKD